MQLHDSNGSVVPERPNFSKDIVIAGATRAFDSGELLISHQADEKGKFVGAIADSYYRGIDAYELAKSLVNKGFDACRDFVEDMCLVDSYVTSENDSAVKQWFSLYEPKAPFEAGTELQFPSWETSESSYGYIEGLYSHMPGAFLVKEHGISDDDNKRRIIKFEEAELRAISIGDLVAPINSDYQLSSGASRYERAVVVSIEPFVLVSESADMRWSSTVLRKNFKIIGKADSSKLDACMKRLGS